MRRPLAVLIAGGILVWACIMAVHVYADEPKTAPEKWKIVIGITNDQGEDLKLVYGTRATGPVYYTSEEECTAALKGDRKFLEGLKAVLKFAHEHKDTVDKPICVLEIKPSEI